MNLRTTGLATSPVRIPATPRYREDISSNDANRLLATVK